MQSTTNDVTTVQSKQPDHWACAISDYGVFAVNGADAQSLLQGQTTCDFKQLKSDHWTMGALCNPKGRVITTFKALATDSGFLLIVPVSMIETVCKRLKMYILRSDVTVTDTSEHWRLIGLSSDLNSLDQIVLPSTNNVTKNGSIYFLGCHCIDGQPSRYLILTKADCVDDCFSTTNQSRANQNRFRNMESPRNSSTAYRQLLHQLLRRLPRKCLILICSMLSVLKKVVTRGKKSSLERNI